MDPPEVTLNLLDGNQQGTLQTWKFKAKTIIRVGRSDDSDVIVRQPMVSRMHSKLEWNGRHWRISNQSQFGTHVGGVPITDSPLGEGDRFQLGPFGPVLSLDAGQPVTSDDPLGTINLGSVADTSIDQEKTAEQVAQITNTDYFKNLQQMARKLKAANTQGPDDTR